MNLLSHDVPCMATKPGVNVMYMFEVYVIWNYDMHLKTGTVSFVEYSNGSEICELPFSAYTRIMSTPSNHKINLHSCDCTRCQNGVLKDNCRMKKNIIKYRFTTNLIYELCTETYTCAPNLVE